MEICSPAAEEAGFDLFLTSDKNMRYQQNLSARKIAIVVLGNSPWPVVSSRIAEIAVAVNAATPGSYVEVEIPLPPKDTQERIVKEIEVIEEKERNNNEGKVLS